MHAYHVASVIDLRKSSTSCIDMRYGPDVHSTYYRLDWQCWRSLYARESPKLLMPRNSRYKSAKSCDPHLASGASAHFKNSYIQNNFTDNSLSDAQIHAAFHTLPTPSRTSSPSLKLTSDQPFTKSTQSPKMIIPIRCFSCGKVVADLWEPYVNLLTEKVPDGEALDRIGCRRYCCRRMIMTHVDLIEKLLK